jgi:arsenite methyltransferase
MAMQPLIDEQTLAAYYQDRAYEYGFDSTCKMELPDDLAGLDVLDVNCRRGKGCLKLSDFVGEGGHVLGTDPLPAYIDKAREVTSAQRHGNGLSANNISLQVAFPERLDAAGVAPASFDVVFINASLNLAYDVSAALSQIARALKPGGRLIYDGVVAEGDRDATVVEQARRINNVVQAALSRDALVELLHQTGFGQLAFGAERPIASTTGSTSDRVVPAVDTDEAVDFTKTTVTAVKA